MAAPTNSPYDALPYEGCAIPIASPQRLATLAHLSGCEPPNLEAARVLEIGCGDGGNLLPLAFHHPNWQFVGLDPSARAIEKAQAGCSILELDNISFCCGDVRAFESDEHHDFVLCHGVYSWVNAEVQKALLRVAADCLAPNGLFYLSYNTEPGWRVRGLVRDRLRRSLEQSKRDQATDAGDQASHSDSSGSDSSGSDSRSAEAHSAKALLKTLDSFLNDTSGHPYLALLKRELHFADQRPIYHLSHEYLAEHNQAFWFGQVLAAANQHGLHYIGDAQQFRREGLVSTEHRELAAKHFASFVEQEETLDMMCYRQLRASVFSHAGAQAASVDRRQLLSQCIVASPLRPSTELRDLRELQDGQIRNFRCPYSQREIEVDSALGKAALLLLGTSYPWGVTFESLVEHARAMLASQGGDAAPTTADESALLEGLDQLQQQALVEARVSQAAWDTTPRSGLPCATPLTRYEARQRAHLTSPLHDLLPIDAVDRMLIEKLDGSCNRERLLEELNNANVKDAAARLDRLSAILVQWGLAS